MTSEDKDLLSDSELLAEHVAGSKTAFSALVRRHQDHLWAVAIRMMRHHEDAADVVQDALVKAFRRADTFRGDAKVSTWLHRIVVTTALDALRASSRAEVLPFVPLEAAEARDSIGRRDTRLDVAAALALVPPDQRAAVVLVDLAGFSVDEAAWALGCPEGTVKSRCSRGRSRLATLLSDYALPATGNRVAGTDVQPNETGGARTDPSPSDGAEGRT